MGGSPGSGDCDHTDWWLHPSPWCQLEAMGNLLLFVLTKLTGWQRAGSTTAQHTGRDRGTDVLPRVQQDTRPGEASARSKQDSVTTTLSEAQALGLTVLSA